MEIMYMKIRHMNESKAISRTSCFPPRLFVIIVPESSCPESLEARKIIALRLEPKANRQYD